MASKRVCVIGGDISVQSMFQNRGWITVRDDPSEPFPAADLFCFTGGADINPTLYGQEPNGARGWDDERDSYELGWYFNAYAADVPMVGICRGGQLLNVMNGGSLIQHLGQTISGIVVCKDQDGESYYTHVDHHQGIVRNTETSESILAFDAGEVHPQGPGVGITYACFYPDTRSLCFQPHPEWGHEPTKDLFFNLLEEYTQC